jgi:hypothetical protein
MEQITRVFLLNLGSRIPSLCFGNRNNFINSLLLQVLMFPLSMSLFSPAEIKEKRDKCWSIMCVHYSTGGANSVLLASLIQWLVFPSLSPELPHNWNNPIRVSAVVYNDFDLFRENAESIPLKDPKSNSLTNL